MKLFRLKEFRKSKGLTQAQVAKGVGISVSYYTDLENEEKYANVRRMNDIAMFFEVPITSLFAKHVNSDIDNLYADIQALSNEHRKLVHQIVTALSAST